MNVRQTDKTKQGRNTFQTNIHLVVGFRENDQRRSSTENVPTPFPPIHVRIHLFLAYENASHRSNQTANLHMSERTN